MSHDERDRAICAAVWRAWRCGRPASYRELQAVTGVSKGSLCYRIHGYQRIAGTARLSYRAGGGLIGQGWLVGDPHLCRTLVPGALFGGLLSGREPLRRIG